MTIVHKARFIGDRRSIEALAHALPGLSYEERDGRFWIWGAPLHLSPDGKGWRGDLDAFARKANVIIALADPALVAIQNDGAVEMHEGGRCHVVVMPTMPAFEIVMTPVTLSATGGGRPRRPASERAVEFAARQGRFERAANIFAECGTDLAKLYFVMELIEKAHGGGFPKKKRPQQRAAFCERIQVEESEWEALHRSARPHRHAEPHEDEGPVLTPGQARALLQHALKLWVDREVPF